MDWSTRKDGREPKAVQKVSHAINLEIHFHWEQSPQGSDTPALPYCSYI